MSPTKLFHTIKREIVTSITRPRTQLTRWQRMFRYAIDLARHARQELRDHSAPTMAAALTYRTIFGLVPMLVMAMIVFRAFGGFADSQDGVRNLVYDLLELEVELVEQVQADPPAADPQITEPNTPSAAAPESDAAPARPPGSWFTRKLQQTIEAHENKVDPAVQAELDRLKANAEMKARIDEFVGGLSEGASSISINSIGVIGMLLLIWAALGLIVTVEKTFNVIYNAPSGRAWLVRIPIYWAIITLGPVLIWGSYYISTRLAEAASGVYVLGWLLGLVNHFTALLVTWLLFLLLFKLMPNARVAIRPAMTGAMVSALAWELMKAALRWYVENAVLSTTQTRLYGSLALIPILLFWVYLTWLVVLAGLEVTHILQTLPASRMGHFEKSRPTPTARDPWLVIPLMSAVAQAFDRGQTIGIDALSSKLDTPPETIDKITRELVGRGMLHRLVEEDGPDTFTLAQPPGRIRITDLIDSAHPGMTPDSPGYALLQQIAQAQRAALSDATLGDQKNGNQ